jgi:hypothetical protein
MLSPKQSPARFIKWHADFTRRWEVLQHQGVVAIPLTKTKWSLMDLIIGGHANWNSKLIDIITTQPLDVILYGWNHVKRKSGRDWYIRIFDTNCYSRRHKMACPLSIPWSSILHQFVSVATRSSVYSLLGHEGPRNTLRSSGDHEIIVLCVKEFCTQIIIVTYNLCTKFFYT